MNKLPHPPSKINGVEQDPNKQTIINVDKAWREGLAYLFYKYPLKKEKQTNEKA